MADHFATANKVLGLMGTRTTIERRKGGVWVLWTGYDMKPIEKRWQRMMGQDFYPAWHHKWPHGGTCTTALSQLVRWCSGRSVLPISTWQYWCGETVKLGRERGPEIIQTLIDGGYPQHADCVLCHQQIVGGMDWWSLNGVSGPCCGMASGCQQKVSA